MPLNVVKPDPDSNNILANAQIMGQLLEENDGRPEKPDLARDINKVELASREELRVT